MVHGEGGQHDQQRLNRVESCLLREVDGRRRQGEEKRRDPGRETAILPSQPEEQDDDQQDPGDERRDPRYGQTLAKDPEQRRNEVGERRPARILHPVGQPQRAIGKQ